MGTIRFRFLENGSPTSAVQKIASALGEDEAEPEEVGGGGLRFSGVVGSRRREMGSWRVMAAS